MATPILATKLYLPSMRPNVVLRPRLLARLNENVARKLTIISAPVGFGKTTLASTWMRSLQRPIAWLSLDEGDNDPVRFLAYLIAALQTVVPHIGAEIVARLGASQASPQYLLAESTLTALLNEIATLREHITLVLDDYHVITAKPIDTALAFLLEHLPPQLHLVLTTREDPHLPLARLRARGQLIELRAADLRFTATEAAEFLNPMMGLHLSAADIAVLEDRTEGWIAGLQLAALSMQGHEDVAQFVRAFAGDHRYIVDYLIEEVLQSQSESIRSFLLQTAILDRLNGPLCDAVTGQQDCQARLEALERGNFFVVPLDDKRHWYRYHHLFGEVLLAHLKAEQPHQIALLHRRASEWYERHGSADEAIRHALAAADFERAADLIELAIPALRQSRQEATMLRWLQALPDGLLGFRPVLSVHYAGTLLLGGQPEGVEQRLQDAEQWLDEGHTDTRATVASQGHPVIVDQEEFRRLPAAISMYRAALALARGDVPATINHARRTLNLSPDDAHLLHGAAAGLLGLAYWTYGNLEQAHQSYAECLARLLKAEYITDTFGCAIALADIRIAQGRLHEAMHTYERALARALAPTQPGGVAPVMRGTADMYVGMSEILRERNDLTAATQHLQRSKALGEQTALPQNRYRWCVAMAGIQAAQGDLASALQLLDEAEHLYNGDLFPNVRPIAAMRVRLWVAQGRLGEALDWARERGLSIEDDLSYLREFEHMTLARVLLARAKNGPANRVDHAMRVALGLLDRLLQAAQAGERTHSIIELLLLQAGAYACLGNRSAALLPLRQAVHLAEPEGYVRMFVDEGPPMLQLLTTLKDDADVDANAEAGAPQAYIRRLIAAFGTSEEASLLAAPASASAISALGSQALIEPLSTREMEVLRLLNTELSGPEIAQALVVGLSTVRTYTKGIYSKLNVNSRRAAVRRAIELGLF